MLIGKLLELWHLEKDLARKYNLLDSHDTQGKKEILKQLLGSIGDNLWITLPFYIDYGNPCHVVRENKRMR